MIRIICSKCKNAYLKNEGEKLVCPSCEAEFPVAEENLLSGIQYYNEGDFAAANDCLMKYIVKNGADPRAIFYKALCDGFNFDEDTTSIDGVYEKLTEALSDINDNAFIQYLALANDEAAKLENLIAEKHIRLFEGADAEKIKNEVSVLIKLQDSAREFRKTLTELADKYNEQAEEKLGVNFSKCFLVKPDLATEVGALKFDRIAESISTHTVFTGILSTDIKNLEIYYRCIVMFFETNRQKYDFLIESAGKFTELAKLLEEGNYNAIKGVPTIGDKLKGAAYDFFQEHLRDHDEEEQSTETVYVIALETVAVEEEVAVVQTTEEDNADASEAAPEFEDVYSSSDAETTVEETPAENIEEQAKADNNSEDTEYDEDVIIEIPVASEEVKADEVIVEDAEAETVAEPEAEAVIELSEADEEAPVEEEKAIEESTDDVAEEATEVVEENIVATEASVDEATEDAVEESTETAEEATDDNQEDAQTSPVEALQAIAEADEIDDISDGFGDDKPYETIVATEEEKEETTPPVKTTVTKHKKSYGPFVALFLIIAIVAGIIAVKVVPDKLNANNYEKAASLYGQKNYVEAAEIYGELGDYEDAQIRKSICLYAYASTLETQKKFPEAAEVYASLGDYEDSKTKANSCNYQAAVSLMDSGDYAQAKTIFAGLDGYADSTKLITECTYKEGVDLITSKDFNGAIEIFTKLGTYSDSAQKILEAKYGFVNENLDAKNETTLTYLNDLAKAKYKDSVDIRNKLLGTTNDLAAAAASCINYSTTDTKTHLSEVENSKKIYFHVTVNDEKLYNQKLSIKYRTSLGYEDGKDIVLTADKNTYAFEYPSTPSKNYTIEFKLLDNNNSTLTTQKITVK